MSPLLVVLVIACVIVIGVVWACVVILSMIFRLLGWGISLPFKALRACSLPESSRKSVVSREVVVRCCGNEKCGSPLPDLAKFCPRCGGMVQGVLTTNARSCRSRAERRQLQIAAATAASAA